MKDKVEDMASFYFSKLDMDDWSNDGSKDIASMFTVDLEGIREVLERFYKAGFEHGYKVAKGSQIDDYGNLVDNSEEWE